MEKFSFYDYIQLRANGRRTKTIVQDLVDDMKCDEELAEKENGQEIVNHIAWRACPGAYEALKFFIKDYKLHCKRKGLEAECVSVKGSR